MNKKEVYNELDSISDFLFQYDINQLSTIGVRYGKLGVALFDLIYASFSKNQSFYKKADEIINIVVQDVLENNISDKRVIENIVDFGKFLEFVKKNKLYNVETNKLLVDLDEFLLSEMNALFDEGDYDVIGGALSVGYYFLLRYNSDKKVITILENTIERLYDLAIKDRNDQLYWRSTLFEGDRIYLGIHGSSAAILFAFRLLELNIKPQLCEEIIRKSCNFIIETEFNHDLCHFPVIIGYPIERGPLEWAYGDLLVGFVLYKTGLKTNNNVFKEKAIKAYDYALKRIHNDNVVVDAGIVHGIIGTAIMFDKMHLLSGEIKYKQTAYDCFKIAFTKFNNDFNGPLGFKAKYDIDCPGSDISFISGISGIGIALIALIESDYYYFDELLFF